MPEFTGESAKNDFGEALAAALQKAASSEGTTDTLVRWQVEHIRGEYGGIAGLQRLVITISTRG